MLAPRRLRALGAALVLLGLVVGGQRPAHAAPGEAVPAPAPAAAPSPPPSEPVPSDTPEAGRDTVLDVVLPCGLRVLAAQDLSLPVAAVVLAVETGSEDDPPEHPGLVHALAYHLHQGNRELRPGEAIAAAQDAGGVHFLSTGPGQVRFESLVPVSRLAEVLFAESQRLRFPTVDRRRWDISLGWAASDVRSPPGMRPKDLAALHGAPGLGHDGRVVDRSLAEIAPAALAAALASRFNYTRATLIVVAPEPPAAVLEQVRARFRDLPPATRALPARPPPPARSPLPADPAAPTPAAAGTALLLPGTDPSGTAAADPAEAFLLGHRPALPAAAFLTHTVSTDLAAALAPEVFRAAVRPAAAVFLAGGLAEAGAAAFLAASPPPAEAGAPPPASPPAPAAPATPPPAAPGKPPLLAWPVPANAAASAWAAALCRALNRQRPAEGEPRKARVACDLDPDPRRGVLVLRPLGSDDPLGLVRARLARLGGVDQALVAAQAQFMAQAVRLHTRTPLGLARQLAASPASIPGPVPVDSPVARRRDELTGLAGLAGRPGLTLAVEDALLLGAAEPKP